MLGERVFRIVLYYYYILFILYVSVHGNKYAHSYRMYIHIYLTTNDVIWGIDSLRFCSVVVFILRSTRTYLKKIYAICTSTIVQVHSTLYPVLHAFVARTKKPHNNRWICNVCMGWAYACANAFNKFSIELHNCGIQWQTPIQATGTSNNVKTHELRYFHRLQNKNK